MASDPAAINGGSGWLCGKGPDDDVVVSSRVRLARNLCGYPFLARASAHQRRELLETCRRRIDKADLKDRMNWFDLTEAASIDRQLLVERHLISRQHSQGRAPRGVAISSDECSAIMVNEEDHIRLQVLRSGMQLQSAFERANWIDDVLEGALDFAYSPKLGYLTACPTNVGTGIRVSVMLHLPALKVTGEIDKLRRAAKDMHLAVRGFHGEGTEAVGDLYQVSNQTTLGRSEDQILSDFQDAVIPQMIEYERRARQAMARERSAVLEDRVWRAWGALCHARLLGSEEGMYLLSSVRMGVAMGCIDTPGVTLETINQLMVLTQPAHLQRISSQTLDDGAQRRQMRADFIRQRLGG